MQRVVHAFDVIRNSSCMHDVPLDHPAAANLQFRAFDKHAISMMHLTDVHNANANERTMDPVNLYVRATHHCQTAELAVLCAAGW